LPTRIMLCGGGSYLPDMQRVLSESSWWKRLPFPKAPTVQFVSPDDVTNIVDRTGDLRGREDITPMGLANLALDYAGEERVMSGLLRRAVKLMQN